MLTKEGLDLIKKHEGLRLNAYKCPAGVTTIGYGHAIKYGEDHLRKAPITQEKAEEILKADIEEIEKALERNKMFLESPRKDAVVSLIFNIGINRFLRSQTYNKLKRGEYLAMAKEWREFNQYTNPSGQKVVSRGLANRREDEIKLFFKAF